MNGELDFTASLKARVALLKGVPADVFEKIKPTITITPGAKELCRALKKLGFKMAVISGGFQPLAEWLAGELGLDWAFANHVCLSLLSSQRRNIHVIAYVASHSATAPHSIVQSNLLIPLSSKSTKQPKL